ncbi:MAG: carboxylate-amine ligase [Gammaproteobacteria bacterium]|nr:carboxylate-amine ligase [Gammaproteobacteria bacterium]NNC98317.1 carboxylate-amine ligase [Gammaproteobacteria bacterium]NNM13377.1 carboxylate-amine ligase [Gammaproteobacteria bacterium]
MKTTKPSLTLGVEEEYFLVDKTSRDLAVDPPNEIFSECKNLFDHQVSHEFIRSQIEIGTKVCKNVAEVREDLIKLRGGVARIANQHGYAPIAASTHPFARWQAQKHTERERYNNLAEDMQAVANRMLIGGMHIHFGIEDEDLRIDLMNQVLYFLPHLLALSCSSPFWHGTNTGLQCYRLTVFNDLPRTGLPAHFDSFAEFERNIGALVNANIIEDATKIWWDIRPSVRYPTLELRIMDVCTNLEDALSIVALAQSIMHMLYRLRLDNKRWREYRKMLVYENRWRAMRYGVTDNLIDFGKGTQVPYKQLLDEMIDMIKEDAVELGCLTEVMNAYRILERGTSSQQQTAVFEQCVEKGESKQSALNSVVDWLVEETVKF